MFSFTNSSMIALAICSKLCVASARIYPTVSHLMRKLNLGFRAGVRKLTQGPAPDKHTPSSPGCDSGVIERKICGRPGIRPLRYGWCIYHQLAKGSGRTLPWQVQPDLASLDRCRLDLGGTLPKRWLREESAGS